MGRHTARTASQSLSLSSFPGSGVPRDSQHAFHTLVPRRLEWGSGLWMSSAGVPANLSPIFCSQGRLPPPSTRALLYFRRLWEVGEVPLSKGLGNLTIMPLPCVPHISCSRLPQTSFLVWGCLFHFCNAGDPTGALHVLSKPGY